MAQDPTSSVPFPPHSPVPVLSDNLVGFIVDRLRETPFDAVVEYGSGLSTRFVLAELLALGRPCYFASVEFDRRWFARNVASIRAQLTEEETAEEDLSLLAWPYARCRSYLRASGEDQLDLPPEFRRLTKGKRRLAGPLGLKGLLYRVCPRLRPHDGEYSVLINQAVRFQLTLRSDFIKDQYGESPVRRDYIDGGLEKVVQELEAGRRVEAAFLIDGGPRAEIVDAILDLEDEHAAFHPVVFLCDAQRRHYERVLARRPAGKFLRGSNRTLTGSQVYGTPASKRKADFVYGSAEVTGEELAARELWFYDGPRA